MHLHLHMHTFQCRPGSSSASTSPMSAPSFEVICANTESRPPGPAVLTPRRSVGAEADELEGPGPAAPPSPLCCRLRFARMRSISSTGPCCLLRDIVLWMTRRNRLSCRRDGHECPSSSYTGIRIYEMNDFHSPQHSCASFGAQERAYARASGARTFCEVSSSRRRRPMSNSAGGSINLSSSESRCRFDGRLPSSE